MHFAQLVAVAICKHIKVHGIDGFLKPFVDDLNRLATKGLTIKVNGQDITYRGTFVAFLVYN